jgi:outer membrane protein assembly factor BamB
MKLLQILFVSVLFLSAPTLAVAQNSWPQFLGPHRNGISDETGLIEAWPQAGLPEVWRVKGGVGMSGVAIDQEKLVTLVQSAGQQQVICLNPQTGKPLWQTELVAEYENAMGNGPRATPAIAGDQVYVYSGEGVLAALQLNDGKLAWQQNVFELLGGKPSEYGMSCSPLIYDESVIVTVGKTATVAAFHLKDGTLKWKCGKDLAGYSSPAILPIGDQRQLVVFTGESLLGVSPDKGELLWRKEYVTDYACNIATPLVIDGDLFISSGENHGSVRLQVAKDGGQWSTNEVWQSYGKSSVMRNEFQTSILLDGFLYGFDNVGSAGPITHLACINAKSGEPVWQEPRFGKGNLILADGKLFISTMKGELVVVQATPDGYQELGRQQVCKQTRQAPVLAGGLLYFRDDAEIICLDARKP